MYAYSNIEYDRQVFDELIETQMYETKRESRKKISPCFAHPKFISSYSLFLARSYFDSCESAIKLAEDLDLCKLDFLAILEDFEAYREEYLNIQGEKIE